VSATIYILKETQIGENRVAVVPETVKKWTQQGLRVCVQEGAGQNANFSDSDYEASGAEIISKSDFVNGSVLVSVRMPNQAIIESLTKDMILIGALDPHSHKSQLQTIATKGIRSFGLEFIPRITRAQSMDILSSQANLAGYRAVIEAAHQLNRAFPMMMTPAGTIAPAKVFIMGVGVAGLQAIATARRLGAVVTATDVRPATKEQVESLGAKFLAVEDDEFKNAQTAGGYAKPMSEAYQTKQLELLGTHLPKQDIVITTALIPGRTAPRLVTLDHIKSMKPGTVIIDLATSQGGNVEGSVADQSVIINQVKISGPTNLPGTIASDASSLFSRNLYAYLGLILTPEGGLRSDLFTESMDEILSQSLLTYDGQIVHPQLKA
jgi:H+-translocating NAD(P) transhydrogenase subunit alpha